VNLRFLGFVGFASLLTVYVLRSGVGSNSLVRAGTAAPEFTVRTLDGDEVSLSDFRGSVVFLNFWRTDCVPCIREMPDMDIVARSFHGRRFHMMPVSADIDSEAVGAFYRERNLTMPAYWDPGQTVASRYDTLGIPETFIIGGDGIVARYYMGQQPWATPKMLAELEELIPF
jgi:peroxiredoxin